MIFDCFDICHTVLVALFLEDYAITIDKKTGYKESTLLASSLLY